MALNRANILGWRRTHIQVGGAIFILSLVPWANANDRGENIYHSGVLTTPYVTLAKHGTQAPSDLFSCVNCHGPRGEGEKEGGLVAPNITWFQLSQNARADADGGRSRSAYTAQSFRRALEQGLDSDGNALSDAMPRYPLSTAEVDALVAYLQKVDQRLAPGVDEHSIHFAVRLPEAELQAQVISKTLMAFAQNLNNQGGIYGRRLELHFLQSSQLPSAEQVFLLLDCRLPTDLREAHDYVEGLPVFALFAPTAKQPPAISRFVNHHFALYDLDRYAAQALRQYALANNLVIDMESPPQTDLPRQALLLNRQHLSQFLAQAPSSNHSPTLLVTASDVASVYSDLTSYSGEVFIAGAPTPHQADAIALRDYQHLAYNYSLPKQHLSAQLWSLSLIQLVSEALRIAGKDLLRESFIDSLLNHYQFTSHFGPTLQFSANKSVGAMGAAIVPFKLNNGQAQQPEWVSVRERH